MLSVLGPPPVFPPGMKTKRRGGLKKKDTRIHNTLQALKEMKARQKQDLVKLVKDLYRRPNTKIEYLPDCIKKRTNSLYNSVSAEDSWDDRRAERLYNRNCGYFSVNDEPYKTLGTVVLDPGELLINVFADSLPPEFLLEYQSSGPGDSSYLKYFDNEDKDESDITISKEDQKRRQSICSSAGYDEIKRVLKESDGRMLVCRAGQSYSNHLGSCQELREAERRLLEGIANEGEVMVVRQLSSNTLLANMDDSDDSNAASPSGQEPYIFERKPALCHGEKFLRPQIKLTDYRQRTAAAEISRQHKKLWILWVRLDNIHSILCSLYNMRSRHLKSKSGLSAKVLQSLKKDPFQEKTAETFPGDGSRFSQKVQMTISPSQDAISASRYDDQRMASRRSVYESNLFTPRSHVSGDDSLHSQRKEKEESVHKQVKIQDGFKHPGGASGVGLVMPKPSKQTTNLGTNSLKMDPGTSVLAGRNFFRRKTKAMLEQVTEVTLLDTWEDLVNIGPGGKTKIIKLIKKIPPWQRQLNYDDVLLVSKKPKVKQSKSEEHAALLRHSELTTARLQMGLLTSKERLQATAAREIERIEREQAVKSRYKLLSFKNMQPLYESHRRKLKETDEEASKDPELIQEETAEWYECLVAETKMAGLSKDRSVVSLLAELNKFVHHKPSTVPAIKEKLCLLCISMPVFEICNAAMQQSLLFVMDKVLNTNKDMLRTCLEYRSLYTI